MTNVQETSQQLDVPVTVDNKGNVDIATNPSKKWYASKTIWFNILFTVLTLVANSLSQLQTQFNLSPEVYAIIFGLINIVLRTVTTNGIKA